MGRLIVITTSDMALGFQLAGVETIAVDQPARAQALLREFLDNEEANLIAIRQDLLRDADSRLQRRVENSYRPVVMAIPGGTPAMPEESRRHYLTELIRRAIGFQITFGNE